MWFCTVFDSLTLEGINFHRASKSPRFAGITFMDLSSDNISQVFIFADLPLKR